MMKYRVTIQDFGGGCGKPDKVIRNLPLRQAWHIVHRAARRGVKMYGGTLSIANWGARGGHFPRSYRTAFIQLD